MKVLGIPASNRNLGSSRLRYYYMLENLPSGWEFERYSPGAQGDILYIQKCESKEVWKAIKDCKRQGIPIVYDRDDFCKPWREGHTKIMNAADACTVITEGLRKVVAKHTTTPTYHVADGLDYGVQPSDRAKIRKKMFSVITYGRMSNMVATSSYFKALKMNRAYICDRLIPELGRAKFYEWNRGKVINRLVKYDLVLCIHAKNHRKKYKDAGRAVLAMALGIPVIAQKNIESKRVFGDAGHPELLIDTPKDLKRVVASLKSYEKRRQISDDLFAYAWANWRVDQAAAKMAVVFEKVIREAGCRKQCTAKKS